MTIEAAAAAAAAAAATTATKNLCAASSRRAVILLLEVGARVHVTSICSAVSLMQWGEHGHYNDNSNHKNSGNNKIMQMIILIAQCKLHQKIMKVARLHARARARRGRAQDNCPCSPSEGG